MDKKLDQMEHQAVSSWWIATDKQLQTIRLCQTVKSKPASVVVPATVGVSRTTFYHDDTHTHTKTHEESVSCPSDLAFCPHFPYLDILILETDSLANPPSIAQLVERRTVGEQS